MTKKEQHQSARTQRREAERIARKLANKEAQRQQASGVTPETPAFTAAPAPAPASKPEPKPLSEAQLAANRANAQHSTGAKTATGQARSAMNALKSGLTGKTVLLPHENADQYQQELEDYIQAYGATTTDELRLVQTAVDCMWRIDRITRLETAIMLKGQIEAAKQSDDQYEDRSPLEQAHLTDADIYLKYERQLRNLNIQEARLRRTLEKTQKALKQAQDARHEHEEMEMQFAERHQAHAATNQNGFEFSTAHSNATGAPEPNQSPQTAGA